MSELKLVVGKKYRTRGGQIATVVELKDPTEYYIYPVYALINQDILYFTSDGYYYSSADHSEYDLIEEITEPQPKQQEIQPMFDKKYKYVAMDRDGFCKFFEVKPKPNEDVACWYSTENNTPIISGALNLGNDWKESLREIMYNDDGSVYLRKPRYDFKVDDKVLVKAKGDTEWKNRHFSHWYSDGTPVCFMGGGTSFTTTTNSSWDEIKPYVEE